LATPEGLDTRTLPKLRLRTRICARRSTLETRFRSRVCRRLADATCDTTRRRLLYRSKHLHLIHHSRRHHQPHAPAHWPPKPGFQYNPRPGHPRLTEGAEKRGGRKYYSYSCTFSSEDMFVLSTWEGHMRGLVCYEGKVKSVARRFKTPDETPLLKGEC